MKKETLFRLLAAWITVFAFMFFGPSWLSDFSSLSLISVFFIWLFVVILWAAFGVVHEAEELADILGEPHGK
jgi:Ca2+:H+ antiporter